MVKHSESIFLFYLHILLSWKVAWFHHLPLYCIPMGQKYFMYYYPHGISLDNNWGNKINFKTTKRVLYRLHIICSSVFITHSTLFCQSEKSYRVSHSIGLKVILLWWGYIFWFLIPFWILQVHEIGAFMPNSSVFIFLMLRALYWMISKSDLKG